MVESAGIKREDITYGDDPKMKGFIAHKEDLKEKVPGVIIVHEWWGHNEYVRNRAVQVAELGYVAMALDMYGDGKSSCHPKEAGEYMKESIASFDAASDRFLKAVETLKKHEHVDSSRIAAIGYCYGGMIVINMAKKGHDLRGIVSYHGSLHAPVKAEKGVCKARMLICNGEADPLVKQEEIDALKKECDDAGIDYQFINYPDAKHGFTNPGATAKGKEFGMPLEYNENADKDSWAKTVEFFKEVFAK